MILQALTAYYEALVKKTALRAPAGERQRSPMRWNWMKAGRLSG